MSNRMYLSFTQRLFLGCIVSVLPGSAAIAEEGTIEEVVVTGSFIKRSTADSPSPLSVVTRADIENIGAVEISDIVNRMTYNSGSTNVTNAFSGGDNSTGETNINLRNLGLGSTLVLLNGRRSVAANTDSGGNAYLSTSTLMPTDPFVHHPRGAVWYLRYAMNL